MKEQAHKCGGWELSQTPSLCSVIATSFVQSQELQDGTPAAKHELT